MPKLSQEQKQEVSSLVEQMLKERLSAFSEKGHVHDGGGELRILVSMLERDPQAWGKMPFNYKYQAETSSDTLTGSAANLITADIAVATDSNVLVMAWCQVNNDAGTARDITLTIERSAVLATALQRLPADASAKANVTFFAIERPESRSSVTYALKGLSGAGSPTVTNKAILAVELPRRRSSNN